MVQGKSDGERYPQENKACNFQPENMQNAADVPHGGVSRLQQRAHGARPSRLLQSDPSQDAKFAGRRDIRHAGDFTNVRGYNTDARRPRGPAT